MQACGIKDEKITYNSESDGATEADPVLFGGLENESNITN